MTPDMSDDTSAVEVARITIRKEVVDDDVVILVDRDEVPALLDAIGMLEYAKLILASDIERVDGDE